MRTTRWEGSRARAAGPAAPAAMVAVLSMLLVGAPPGAVPARAQAQVRPVPAPDGERARPGDAPARVAPDKPPAAEPPGAWLGDLTWPEAKRRLREAPLVILPFGAGAKEHGPHLPMNADWIVAEYLCQRAVERLPVVVAPPVQHGWFPAFREFPGTEVADPDVFRAYVMEVARSLVRHGARRLVLLNTGIARATGLPLGIVAREIRVETGTPTLLVSWDDLESEETLAVQEAEIDGHAGEVETSIHLHLQPDLVRMDRAVRDVGEPGAGFPGYRPGLFSTDPDDPDYSTTGVTGDATLATAEKGRAFLEIMTRRWLAALEGFADRE